MVLVPGPGLVLALVLALEDCNILAKQVNQSFVPVLAFVPWFFFLLRKQQHAQKKSTFD